MKKFWAYTLGVLLAIGLVLLYIAKYLGLVLAVLFTVLQLTSVIHWSWFIIAIPLVCFIIAILVLPRIEKTLLAKRQAYEKKKAKADRNNAKAAKVNNYKFYNTVNYKRGGNFRKRK